MSLPKHIREARRKLFGEKKKPQRVVKTRTRIPIGKMALPPDVDPQFCDWEETKSEREAKGRLANRQAKLEWLMECQRNFVAQEIAHLESLIETDREWLRTHAD